MLVNPDVKVPEMSWGGEGELGELVEDRKRFKIGLTTDGEKLPRRGALAMACLKNGINMMVTPSTRSVLVRIVARKAAEIAKPSTPFEGVCVLVILIIVIMNLVTVPVPACYIEKYHAALKSVPIDIKPDLER